MDALRAPVVSIVGGKVVAFCSAGCKEGREPTPLPPPAVPEVDTIDMETDAEPERAAAEPEDDLTPLPPSPQGPPSPVLIAATSPPAHRLRRMWLLGLVAIGGVGMGTLVLAKQKKSAVPSAAALTLAPSSTPRAAEAAESAPAPPPVAPPAPLDRARLLADARGTLTAALADPSSRVRMLAAKALSRTGDAAAMQELQRALEGDPSEIRRLEVAYALARAGQTAGLDYLTAALKSTRRDVRLEAARALVLLKDTRGVDRLHEVLGAVQLRLGAAESLALVGDKDGVALLRETLTDGKGEESRMRAAVALGRAGDDSGRDLLHKIVAEARLEVGAEEALARLGDREAVPGLTRALGLSALRVGAAVGLRRLGADVDLGALATALEHGDEVGKISAAEALLVLLLPEPPAELK